MRIMVVDDEHIFTALLKEQLRQMGFTDVTAAQSGEEALAIIAAETRPFDCFLLDIKMEEMDGIQLCSRIREMPEYRIAPIIMITSVAAKIHMQDAFEAGATDYMTKPIEYIDLRVRIQIAMLLVETLQSEAESRMALQTMLKASPESRNFDLGMRITFSEVSNMRDYFQLENRLLRLSEGLYAMTLLSIEIGGIEKLEKRLTQSAFLSLIQSVAQILGRTLPATGTTLTYVGYGKFICLIVVRNQIVPNLLQARIRDAFAEFLALQDGLDADDLHLDVSALSQKRILSPEIAMGLIRRYVGSLGKSSDMLLPPISQVQDRLFRASKYAPGRTA